jgi:hypothetical protein
MSKFRLAERVSLNFIDCNDFAVKTRSRTQATPILDVGHSEKAGKSAQTPRLFLTVDTVARDA